MPESFVYKPLKDRLSHAETGSEAYKKLVAAVEEVPANADIAPEYLDGSAKVKFKTGSDAHTHIGSVDSTHSLIEMDKKSSGANYKANEALGKDLTEHAKKAHTAVDKVAKHTEDLGADLVKHFNDGREEITKAVREGKLDPKAAEAEFEKLNKEFKELQELRAETGKLVGHHRGEIAKKTTVQSKGSVQKIGDVAKDATRTAEGKLAPLAPTVELAEKEWEKLSWMQKRKTAISHAWDHSGGFMKFARVVGTGAGAIIGIKGIKDFVAPGVDENGQPKERDMGTLFKSAAELVGGGAVVYISLAGGGKGHALGK